MKPFGYTASRYVAAALLMLYGFAKLTGAQFTTLESELDKPMREVSGFWLTWYYFGYSRTYGTLLALVQIAGAAALLTARFVLIAACVLFLVVGNIILIDVFYGVDLSALAAAVVIEACLARILVQHRGALSQLLLPAGRTRWISMTVLLLATFGTAYWLANANNRLPTPIDDTWTVTSAAPGAPSRVYFERNRAHMCVFRYANGRTEAHHFEVDAARRSVRIWQHWLSKGPLLFEGTYDATSTRMELQSQRGERMTLLRR